MKNLVAIVGRPNVGKSSLFNKLIGKRIAIVHDEEGVTRDRIYHTVSWTGHSFNVIDTGGISVEGKIFQDKIRIQAQIAIEESNVIILVIDGIVGLDKDDQFIISLLRKSGKKVFLAVNKLEGNKEMNYNIYSSGINDVFPISALHGDGIGDLLEAVVKELDFTFEKKDIGTKLGIIGRPNVGKSSLLNSLSKTERAIVSPISGTTRDSVDAPLSIDDELFSVVDTAGINKKSKLIETVDHYALTRAFSSLEQSEITLLVIDATRPLSHFDARIAGYSMEHLKPLIIVVNKWDLIDRKTNTMINYEKMLRKEFKFLSWAPITFISAINSERLEKLKETILNVKYSIERKIKTRLLNEMVLDITTINPAKTFQGGKLNVSFIKQVEARIPTFIIFVNDKKFAHFTYVRFLENQFREYFGFVGTPIRLLLRNKKGGRDE